MSPPDDLNAAVRAAACRPEVVEAVGGIYGELMQRIDRRRPLCRASGRCCRFDEFGHRLYVTTVELAAFVAELPPRSTGVPPVSVAWEGGQSVATLSAADTGGTPVLRLALPVAGSPGGCIYQIDGLCSVHPIRPFGCRVFFCDATSDDWQHAQYEEFHARLKQLHEDLGVPYYYLEWRQALAHLGLSPA